MTTAKRRLERFAGTTLPILLIGPTGTGKEVMARHVHAMSGRRGTLVDVNCGALPRDMVESLLFGHRRGAFTGAVESVTGLIACANEGTLFLDELTSLPLEGQAKLLRVLENGELKALGSTVNTSVDFRLVAAVQDDILERLESHQFRRD
jgi:two-component system response regulator FlrC